MSSAPPTWATAPIGKLCSLLNGRAFKPTEWSNTGLPIVRIQNLNNPAAPFNRFNGEFDSRHYLTGGELLFAWSGTPGTSFGAHLWKGGEALLNQHIFRVDFDERQIDKRFFRFAINQKLSELIEVAHGGAGLQHVTKGVFEATEISLPGRGEQKRIADKLDTVLARVDACRDRLARVAPLLERFRQSVLAAATSGRLTEDWRNSALGESQIDWRLTSVGALSEVVRGASPRPAGDPRYFGGDCPWITVGELTKDESKFLDKTRLFVTEAGRQRSRYIAAGTLLLTNSGATLGVPKITRIGGCINDGSVALLGLTEPLKSYLYWLLRSKTEALRALNQGAAQPNLNTSIVKAIDVPLPPTDERAEIVRRVETLFAFADRLEARLAQAKSAVDRLTPSLLAKAFRGELVPQDPADEPAAELLKRLVAQRAAAPAAPRRRRAATAP